MASADDYSCIYDDILVLTSVYCPDCIKFFDDIFFIVVLFLKGEICRKNLSCAELFLPGIFFFSFVSLFCQCSMPLYLYFFFFSFLSVARNLPLFYASLFKLFLFFCVCGLIMLMLYASSFIF